MVDCAAAVPGCACPVDAGRCAQEGDSGRVTDRFLRVPIRRRGARADECGGRGISHLVFTPMRSREVRLARRPHGEPVPEDFELAERELAEPGADQLLVRNVFMSVDPYMRGRMNDAPSYVPPYELGKAMLGGAVGEVVGGEEAGTLVVHGLGWREAAVLDANRVQRAAVPDGVSASALLGALGMPGLTAWVGVTDIAPVAEGETVFISAAAGAVGSVAGQIAKARGCRVIGSAGAPEKVVYVRDELGFDAAFSHHDDVRAALRVAAPNGVDVYFDNVGGPQLEAAIGALNQGGRIALCGAVSQYNATEPAPGPRNLALLVGKRGRMRGFIVSDHADRDAAFRAEVGGLIGDGRLKLAETVVDGGIEAAPGAFVDMLRGRHLGKVVVRL
jgi:NADPH-dependent curcumin reductase CurA